MRREGFQSIETGHATDTPGGTQTRNFGLHAAAASWQRCLHDYDINPQSNNVPDILTAGEFHRALEPTERALVQSREELDSLSAIVRPLGYATLIADSNGVILDVRSLDAAAESFTKNGTQAGGIWSEAKEGTNGIGTCLYTRQPLTVRRDQHFRTRHKMFSCSGAPIFDWRGETALVLCLAGCNNEIADHSHAMALALTVSWARIIEERLFREHFQDCWTLAIAAENGDGHGLLFAIDSEQKIVGADHRARTQFAIDEPEFTVGISLWSRFDRGQSTLKWIKSGDDTAIRLSGEKDTCIWHGLVTPPAGRLARVSKSITRSLHTRPRLAILASLPKVNSGSIFRGGLTGVACGRVLQYIENNLNNSIHVDALASKAGLSVHHFTREFSRTVGEAPHAYILRRRLEKSVEMIESTNKSLAEIALALGFSDQSHFTRRFARHVGMTPGAFRRGCSQAAVI